ncbi:MAG: hypothetical protein WAW37_05190 [Syntrophobacteraceae bacterium]
MKTRKRTSEFDLLRGCLLMKGMILEDWAEANGYNPHTVRTIVRRHWGKDSKINGILTSEIIGKLKTLTDEAKTA